MINKTPNPSCKNCGGRGYMLYEDSWDSDNGEPCWECFPTPIVSVELEVFKDKTVSKITCGKGKDFKEVLGGLRACIKELQYQVKNRKKCPANKERY